jgi:hypothetical protein
MLFLAVRVPVQAPKTPPGVIVRTPSPPPSLSLLTPTPSLSPGHVSAAETIQNTTQQLDLLSTPPGYETIPTSHLLPPLIPTHPGPFADFTHIHSFEPFNIDIGYEAMSYSEGPAYNEDSPYREERPYHENSSYHDK